MPALTLPERLAYSVDETLAMVPVGRTTLYAAMKSGELPYKQVGSKRLITRPALLKYLGYPEIDRQVSA